MTIALAAGDDRVVVDETRGGRLASLSAGGAERLLAPVDDPFGWGCFPMAPWAGRVADAHVAGTDIWLRPNIGPHAMHGVVYDRRWTVDDADDHRAVLHCDLPSDRWPPGGRVAQEIALEPGRLRLTLRVTAGDVTMPAAVGWHPWFLRPDHADMRVEIDAALVLATTDDLIPTGDVVPTEGALDLRDGPMLGDRRLDHAYVGVRGPATVTWPDLTMTITMPDHADTAVVHTPARGVCVEPQTAWPDPFTRPERSGVTVLDPGDTLAAATTWTWW